MKNWIKALSFFALLVSGTAMAFVDQIAVSPAQPNSNQPITVSFRSGGCDGVIWPVAWELQGTGSTRDLVVEGLYALDPLFCTISVGTTSINIGSLPPGEYQIHIKIVDPDDGFGGIPSFSFGSANFTVGEAPHMPIPTLQPFGLFALVIGLIGVAWSGLRKKSAAVSWLAVIALPVLMMPAVECVAADVFVLEVTLIPPPSGPSEESVVEGYDFSSGQSPPFAAITAGSHRHAAYLLPIRVPPLFANSF